MTVPAMVKPKMDGIHGTLPRGARRC